MKRAKKNVFSINVLYTALVIYTTIYKFNARIAKKKKKLVNEEIIIL